MKKYLFSLILALAPSLSWANTADLSWSPPLQYEDGSTLLTSEIKNYKIYYGNAKGGPYQFVVTVPGSNSAVTISNLSNGTWYFVATTVTVQDSESAPSIEVSKVVNVVRKPKAPSAFTVK